MSQLSQDNKEEQPEEKKSDPSESNACALFIKQVETALTQAKSEKKILMVLIEKEEITSLNTWNDPEIIDNMKKYTICLLIHENTLAFKQFTVLYPIIDFPTIYCINPQNGQVLECKYKQQITIQSVIQSIQMSYQSMIKQLNQQQKQQISQPLINTTPVTPPQKKKSALTKLEQIREKAKTQKVKKTETNNNIKIETKSNIKTKKINENNKNKNKKQSIIKPSKAKVLSLNNYNFNENKLDVIESMEITRRNKNKLRKRNNNKVNVNNNKRRNNNMLLKEKEKDDDIYANTPILSAATDTKLKNKIELNNSNKKSRLLFIINNGVNIEKHFNYNCKLIEIMNFIINETGMNDFIFISQYPPINIDSIYLNQKMSNEIGLLDNILNNSQNYDEKSNESMYDKMQNILQKTLYELNLIPSCRIFIKPKFKGYKKKGSGRNENANIITKIIYFIIDLINIIIEYGYEGIVFVFTLIVTIINIPLKFIGIGKDNNNNNNNNTHDNRGRMNNNPRRVSSKLPPYKKNKRLQGKKSGMARLKHLENEDDKNKYSNGNSTMYGGDK